MTLYPEVQKRAQEELDAVVGTQRLPFLTDKPNLPYLRALVLELHSWQPLGPLGVPHVSTEADTYGDYVFPKGTVFIPNVRSVLRTRLTYLSDRPCRKFLHEPNVYADPWTFKPERFLAENGHIPEADPRSCAFGFGRR